MTAPSTTTHPTPTKSGQRPRIGVLAMQGAFAEHVRMLEACDAEAFEVRSVAELELADAIVLPGGESTAIRKALSRCGLLAPLRARIEDGMPAFGTCAGMIVLADAEPDGAPPCFGLLDIDVARNGFGRQVHSFEAEVELTWQPGGDDGEETVPPTTLHGVFIRAPRITRVGADVEVIGRVAADAADRRAAGEPVVVRQGSLLAASFHPELTAGRVLHERFVRFVRAAIDRAEPALRG